MSSNFCGLILEDSRDNTIIENIIRKSDLNLTFDGIGSFRCIGNTFYHNNIYNYVNQAHVVDSLENWHNSAEGNYWSDYTGGDANRDGIGDIPYRIDDHNVDWYPLIKPWKQARIFNVAKTEARGAFKGYNITNDSNHVIEAFNFTRIGIDTYPRQLSFNITAGSGGFCNITIPRAWFDGPFSLFVNNVNKTFDQLTQTATNSFLYFTYAAGKFQVKIIATKSGAVEGDINSDGTIDMKDISTIAKRFGEYLPSDLTPEDVTDYDP